VAARRERVRIKQGQRYQERRPEPSVEPPLGRL
jgi:hypothetical protein